MHEMSIITSVLSIVQDEMKKNNVTRLLSVKLCYGDLSNVVPEALSFAFEALTLQTELAGARLETERIPLTLHCSQCGHEFDPPGREYFLTPCPQCGETLTHTVVKGRELYLQHIEAE